MKRLNINFWFHVCLSVFGIALAIVAAWEFCFLPYYVCLWAVVAGLASVWWTDRMLEHCVDYADAMRSRLQIEAVSKHLRFDAGVTWKN